MDCNEKYEALIFAFLFTGLISYIDFYTGDELSFSFFYLIPLAILALNKNITIVEIIACSVYASTLWFIAEYATREYSMLFFPIWNALVRFLIFSILGVLILSLKKTQVQLNLTNVRLTELNQEKNIFIGTASHDLRSPIGSIYGFSNLLLEDYKTKFDPEATKIINIIRSVSEHTLVVLDNLLDISKIESGKVDLTLKMQNYNEFVVQQIAVYQLLANNKNITINFISYEPDITISFDEHYMSEVVGNLLSNAIKYSFNQSKIDVILSITDNNRLLTEIKDNGKGIPENEQQKLFNYFQTTSTRPTEGEKSTGLGLAIAKKIVQLHQGEIAMRSNDSQGSVFYFTLPV